MTDDTTATWQIVSRSNESISRRNLLVSRPDGDASLPSRLTAARVR